MPNFDYITAKEFRESLEADHSEMLRCAETHAWKSVHVLAGSIVETLLLDYLVSTTNEARPKKDPLKLDLLEAIEVCKAEKVLSERTADLCSVIRSYRNLIHPGRSVRLKEKAPDKASSTIALTLIGMISDELATVLRQKVGLSAEQILSKIQRDSNSLTILKHLLEEVSDSQRERLLLDLIPTAHRELIEANAGEEGKDDLELAYRLILENSSPDVQSRLAMEFVRILREDDGDRVVRHSRAFFRASDLRYVSRQSVPMVREHLLGSVNQLHSMLSLRRIDGIAPFLEPTDVMKWLDPYVLTLVTTTTKAAVKEKIREQLSREIKGTTVEFDKAVFKRLNDWIIHSGNIGSEENAALVSRLKEDLEAQQIPF